MARYHLIALATCFCLDDARVFAQSPGAPFPLLLEGDRKAEGAFALPLRHAERDSDTLKGQFTILDMTLEAIEKSDFQNGPGFLQGPLALPGCANETSWADEKIFRPAEMGDYPFPLPASPDLSTLEKPPTLHTWAIIF